MDPISQPINPYANQMSQQQKKAMDDLQQIIDQKVLAVFNSPEGDALLDAWDDIYLRQPVFVLGAPEGYAQMREGENNIVRKIRKTVNRARGPKQ
jgi:hypothetical protein